MEGVVWPAFELHDKQLQLASSGNQFSKIWPVKKARALKVYICEAGKSAIGLKRYRFKTYSALACFTLMPASNIKTVLSVSVARTAAFSEGMNRLTF